MGYKRYWVQGDHCNIVVKGFKIYLKTNNLNKAIDKMKRYQKRVFIWDCLRRELVGANYNCIIV